MPPELYALPFTPESPSHFVHIVTSLLSSAECSSIINNQTNLTPSNVTASTRRDREIFDDNDITELVWERLKQFYGADRIEDEDGEYWAASGLNSRWRLCRYGKGGKFSPHQDGRRLATVDEQSFMTVNIYLNTVPQEYGGATRFLRESVSSHPGEIRDEDILGKVQPLLGSAALFRDSLWHDGEELLGSEKYLLRTDVMYVREVPFDFNVLCRGLSNDEKGKKALGIAEALEDAGNNEDAVGWYKKAFRLCPSLET